MNEKHFVNITSPQVVESYVLPAQEDKFEPFSHQNGFS